MKKKKELLVVLVTGGLGYIGSHVCVELLRQGHKVVIVDDLSNSKIEVLDRIKQVSGSDELIFCKQNLLEYQALKKLFSATRIDAVMHFAGFKSVGESVAMPILYYRNNIQSTMNLLECMREFGVKCLIFSSSATVYGSSADVPFSEEHKTCAINPYGRTKLFIEEIIRDFYNAYQDFSVCILRYFNPVGAHPSGSLGEDPCGIPNNLMPLIAQVAAGKRQKLSIFGADYQTPDGTCIRDYVHVVDLALGHIKALEIHLNESGCHLYNLGRGKGISVFEMIHTFELANSVKIDYVIKGRRLGDSAISYANVEKAKSALNWEAGRDEFDMCRDTWNWQCGIKSD